jgi:hypothetical protein
MSATLTGSHAFIDDNASNNYLGYQTIPASSGSAVTVSLAHSSCFSYTVTTTTTFSLYMIVGFSSGTAASSTSQFQYRLTRVA